MNNRFFTFLLTVVLLGHLPFGGGLNASFSGEESWTAASCCAAQEPGDAPCCPPADDCAACVCGPTSSPMPICLFSAGEIALAGSTLTTRLGTGSFHGPELNYPPPSPPPRWS